MWLRLCFFAVLISLTGAAAADSLHWRCWYDQQSHITCLVDTVAQARPAEMPNLPANLPAIVKVMRTAPESLRNRIIHIPLHTDEPTDMEFTGQLAKATVCGSRRDCTVHFTDKLPPAGEIVALLNKNLPRPESGPALAMLGDGLDDIE